MPTNLDLELQERLGYGSMTEVWKAFDPQLQRNVAVKLFQADLLNDPDFMASYQNLPRVREAKLIVSLRHPNIVRMHGFNITPPSESEKTLAYIVMDYIEGPTFADYLRDTSYRKEFPSASEVENLFASIAAAIDYAHQQGVIHGDLKPTNILLNTHNTSRHPMGEPMLTDFSISRLLETSTGALGRKELDMAFYISPEQAQGQPANERSDIYALGVMLYEICTGTRPFQGDSPAIIRKEQVNTLPPPPAQVNPHISPALSAIIMRSLAKDPAERFPNAASMATAHSEAFGDSAPESLSQPVSPADTMNGQANLSSTESTQLSELVPSTVSSPPHVAAQSSPPSQDEQDTRTIKLPRAHFAARFSPPSPMSEGTGQDVRATPLDTSEEGKRRSESQEPSRAFSTPNPPSTPWPTSWGARSSASPFPPITRPVSPSRFVPGRKPRGSLSKEWRIALIAILILLLVATTLGALLLLPRKNASTATPPAPTIPVVGHVYFLSSGQLYVNNNQGIYDEVLIDLHNLATPSPGKSYDAWLLGDSNQSDVPWISLGKLSVTQGKVHFLYPGDQAHTNLLIDFSRILITQEDANAPSINPFFDARTWRYYGEIYQLPSPKDPNHFSMLDHLRHLLVQAPELKVLGLPGGLSIWLLRNVEEVLRWSVEAKDRFANTAAVRGLLTNILYYLDGECAPADLQGAPAGTPLTPGNATLAQIARFSLINPCLQEQQEQADILKQVFRATPHDYVDHTLFHLTGVVQSPGATSDLTALATQLNRAVSDLKKALERVRQDAQQLVRMSNGQLHQSAAFALVGDMALQARYAYAGQIDPITGNSQEGAIWVYNNVQRLANFDVTPYSSK
jgi:serine/threonine protein kinase